MDEHNDHKELIEGFYREQKELFDSSSQGVYAFLDDDSRVCNAPFATMLGYDTPQEWAGINVEESFPDAFVTENSQHTLVEAYQNAMENGAGATIQVSWKKKTGESVATTVMLVPVLYKGHMLALHFVTLAG